MRLWLDDCRPAPEGWVHAKTVAEAKAMLLTGTVEEASLDHDLNDWDLAAMGEDTGYMPTEPVEATGSTLVLWMAEHDLWPKTRCTVHSQNPVGAERMRALIARYGPYGKDHA